MVLLLLLVLPFSLGVVLMISEQEKLYKDIIKVLAYLELIITDEKKFNVVRKNLLDIANDVKRLNG